MKPRQHHVALNSVERITLLTVLIFLPILVAAVTAELSFQAGEKNRERQVRAQMLTYIEQAKDAETRLNSVLEQLADLQSLQQK
jgi:hypothetical protein